LFKRLLVILCLLLLAGSAFATIYLIEPVDRRFSNNDEISFGKIARGETLKVIIKEKSDLADEWASLDVDSRLLPSGWTVESIETDETLIAKVTIPRDAEISTQRIKFTAKNPSGEIFDETFFANVSVLDSLLTASIENLNKDALMGDETSFNLVLNNDSIAEHFLKIESTLPGYWFSSQTVTLKPHETRAVELPVSPLSYGEKPFFFNLSSSLNSKQFSFPANLSVKPTLVGMYQASIFGFPFFSPSMLPFYLVNGFLSIFDIS